jgi:hypothetical protein
MTVGIEYADMAKASAVIFVQAPRGAMSEGHNQTAADVLDIEGRPVFRQARKAKSAVISRVDAVKIGVVRFAPSGQEIRCVKKCATARRLRDGAPFVERLAGIVFDQNGVRTNRGIPA